MFVYKDLDLKYSITNSSLLRYCTIVYNTILIELVYNKIDCEAIFSIIPMIHSCEYMYKITMQEPITPLRYRSIQQSIDKAKDWANDISKSFIIQVNNETDTICIGELGKGVVFISIEDNDEILLNFNPHKPDTEAILIKNIIDVTTETILACNSKSHKVYPIKIERTIL